MKISNLLSVKNRKHASLGPIVELSSTLMEDGSAAFTVEDAGIKLRLTKATAVKLAKELNRLTGMGK